MRPGYWRHSRRCVCRNLLLASKAGESEFTRRLCAESVWSWQNWGTKLAENGRAVVTGDDRVLQRLVSPSDGGKSLVGELAGVKLTESRERVPPNETQPCYDHSASCCLSFALPWSTDIHAGRVSDSVERFRRSWWQRADSSPSLVRTRRYKLDRKCVCECHIRWRYRYAVA